jgi:hypothetical protein
LQDTQSRDITLVFKPWRAKEVCDTCNDYHEGFELLCNGELIEGVSEPHGSIAYVWDLIAKQLFKHLRVDVQVLETKVFDASGTHTLRVEHEGKSFRRRVVWYDDEVPGEKGLAFLRQALTFVGFDPTIEVSELEKI